MQNARLFEGAAIDPSHRGDASIPADGATPDRLGPAKSPVRFGVLQGQARIADDFDAPLPDYLLDAFEGR
ncbi:hypothetical protein [Burkholderia sp. JKS000303]|uniref:hypothetical protein n=1 Tax=Burkholderia sp. JKS000303 TaxID=1938747 RepID=UPI000BF2EC7A|nr:hypothetical protein [Burkholderia sp. JKS000303]PFH28000.1 hypothetical protein BX604_1746 [Burkholderia sp. JKS000303]